MVENKENKVEEAKKDKEISPSMDFEFMGKKFDLSTEKGRIEAQAWSEAFSKMHGKQTNELGELRKFHKRLAPATDESKLIEEVKRLKDDGDEAQMAELLLANQRNLKSEIMDELKKERSNDKAWKRYFDKRKDVLSQFDEDYVRDFSERNLGIFDAQDPYAVLDAYWLPKAKDQREFSSAKRVETDSTADVRSAKAAKPKKAEEPVEEADPLDEILSDVRKKALSS